MKDLFFWILESFATHYVIVNFWFCETFKINEEILENLNKNLLVIGILSATDAGFTLILVHIQLNNFGWEVNPDPNPEQTCCSGYLFFCLIIIIMLLSFSVFWDILQQGGFTIYGLISKYHLVSKYLIVYLKMC